MGLFDALFGGNKVKTKVTKSFPSDTFGTRYRTTVIDRSSKKGGHETIFSKSETNPRTGKTTYKEGWHGTKNNKK